MTQYAHTNTEMSVVGFGGHALTAYYPISTERYTTAAVDEVVTVTPPDGAIYFMANFYGNGGFRYTLDGVTVPVASTNVGHNATGGNLLPIRRGFPIRFASATAGNVLVVTWFGTV